MIVWAERRPSHCASEHRLAGGKMLVGWLTCSSAYPALGHRTWLCGHLVEDRECGLMILHPPHRP